MAFGAGPRGVFSVAGAAMSVLAASDARWTADSSQGARLRDLLPSWLPTRPIFANRQAPQNDKTPGISRGSVRCARLDSNQ